MGTNFALFRFCTSAFVFGSVSDQFFFNGKRSQARGARTSVCKLKASDRSRIAPTSLRFAQN